MQRRIVQLVAETGEGHVQLIRRMSGIGAAVDIPFQHLQAEPQALFCRHAAVHLLRQPFGFAQQRLGVMHQLNVAVSRVAVNRQLQGVDTASAGRDQRNHRTAQARGERIDVDAQLLFFRNVEHVERHDAGDPQLQQL